jgi:hypothetical protein
MLGGLEQAMKPRHAATLALMGWVFLISDSGPTVPKNQRACTSTLQEEAMGVSPLPSGFATKAECEAFGAKWVHDFYANADKNDERVCRPPATRCHETFPK